MSQISESLVQWTIWRKGDSLGRWYNRPSAIELEKSNLVKPISLYIWTQLDSNVQRQESKKQVYNTHSPSRSSREQVRSFSTDWTQQVLRTRYTHSLHLNYSELESSRLRKRVKVSVVIKVKDLNYNCIRFFSISVNFQYCCLQFFAFLLSL
jgi:hypothetical protein